MAESSEVPASVVEQPTVEAKATGAEGDNAPKKIGKGKGGGKGKGKVEGVRLNVKNLSGGITTEQLKTMFSPFGNVVAAEVKIKEDGHSRGFGFVVFSSEEESKKAMADMNNKEIGGKQLNVAPAERREGGEDGKGKGKGKGTKGDGKDGKYGCAPSGPFGGGSGFRLNVKNLAADTLAEKLRELFQPFGTVTDAQVKLKDDGKSRGFGFVIFSTEEEGRKAIAEMDGKEVGRGGGKISVAPAERRVEEEDDVMMGGKGKGKMGAAASDIPGQQAAYAAYMQHMMMMQHAYMQQAAMWGASPYAGFPPATPGEYEGMIKSLIAKGHGFIECAQTFMLYNCDIYIDLTTVPKGAVVGSRVKFTVTANPGEHPKAATATLA